VSEPRPAGDALLAALSRQRVVAVVRHHDAGAAHEIARACIAGGLGLVEITLTTPDAYALVADLSAHAPAAVTIGVGTVLDARAAEASVEAGARFLVSPVTDAAVMEAATATGVPLVPGAATPTEVATAAGLGAPVVKVFPAGGLGLPFLRAVATVLPGVPLMPSGGVGVADVPAWLDAGALAVAVGSELEAAHRRGGADAVVAVAAAAVATVDEHRTAARHRHDPFTTTAETRRTA
jgi:2-dehydro-3-deoxyphosphogluconate aldolase/(4S)-4-hydroxy-2-oxoglutarate aldolase